MGLKQQKKTPRHVATGLGQLTLVEHCLCPLDVDVSLREQFVHHCEYYFTDSGRRRQKAHVCVDCARGLSPTDELILWGLLSITLSGREPTSELYVTPHFCMRRLGIISPDSKGGKNYATFREVLYRLAGVQYWCDRFYDPMRREHRQVDFGLLSYSLPLDPDSSRAWRIIFDPIFFEFCHAAGGRVTFDLDTYRSLDCASRRLFLLLKKMFWRRRESPAFDVRELATSVLGYSPQLQTKILKSKVKRCARRLLASNIVALPNGAKRVDDLFIKRQKGKHVVQFHRGNYFNGERRKQPQRNICESPLYDPLRSIGFDASSICRIISRFKTIEIQQWTDVTLAAMERDGGRFIRRSPQAFFMDNIQQAAKGRRTPPDWFRELEKQEQLQQADQARRARDNSDSTVLRSVDGSVSDEMFHHFRAAGQPDDLARKNARRFAQEHHRHKTQSR